MWEGQIRHEARMATGTRRSGSPSAGDEGLRREATACCPSRVTRWQSNVLRFKSSHHRGLYHANDSSRLIIPGTHDSPMYQFNFSFTFGNLFWFLRGPREAHARRSLCSALPSGYFVATASDVCSHHTRPTFLHLCFLQIQGSCVLYPVMLFLTPSSAS